LSPTVVIIIIPVLQVIISRVGYLTGIFSFKVGLSRVGERIDTATVTSKEGSKRPKAELSSLQMVRMGAQIVLSPHWDARLA
jgi:hypothetical protein